MVAFIEYYEDDILANDDASVESNPRNVLGSRATNPPWHALQRFQHPPQRAPDLDAERNREIANLNAINELKMGFANSNRVPTILSEYVLHCLDCWCPIGAMRYFFDMFNELEFSVSQEKFDAAFRAFNILKNAYDGELDNDPRFVMVGDGERPAMWIDSVI